MPYQVIKGEFHIFYPDIPKQGPEPDGDTLKFKPDNRALIEGLWVAGQREPDFNGRDMLNLRFEGMDALETHFEGGHQNIEFAKASRDYLLTWAGFGAVKFWENRPHKVQSVEHNPVRGYILSKGLDPFGRAISFVFLGETDLQDGAVLHLEPELLAQSFNYVSLSAGQSYPLFYRSLPISISRILAEVSDDARRAERGLYAQDQSAPHTPVEVTPETYQDLVIWPKLFRRLHSYFSSEFYDLSGFDDWLRRDPRDRDDRMFLPDDYDAHFHNVISVLSPTELQLNVDPKDIIILPFNTTATEVALIAAE